MEYVNRVTIFDQPYPEDKISEGLNVLDAMLSGACNKCVYLSRCETEDTMEFPEDAPCMTNK